MSSSPKSNPDSQQKKKHKTKAGVVHFDQFVVYLAGFPRISDAKIIEQYMKDLCPDEDYQVVKSNTNLFRGFVLINFKTYYASNIFMQQDVFFQGKQLESSTYYDEKTYIEKCLDTLREPKVVFIDKVPKHVTKEDLEETCSKFGDIEETRLIIRKELPINYAFINYYEYSSAEKCIDQAIVKTPSGTELEVYYAKPKFSEFKFKKIDPLLREYLIAVKEGLIPYNPKDFVFLHDATKDQKNGLTDLSENLDQYLKEKNGKEDPKFNIQFNLNFNNNNFQQNVYQDANAPGFNQQASNSSSAPNQMQN